LILDGKKAGFFHKEIKGNKSNIENYNRRIIANDVKMLAQISNKQIEAIISKDVASFKQHVQPLQNLSLLNVRFFDLNIPLKNILATLF